MSNHREHIDSREGRFEEADAYAGYQEYLDSLESSEGWFHDLDHEPDPMGGYEPSDDPDCLVYDYPGDEMPEFFQ